MIKNIDTYEKEILSTILQNINFDVCIFLFGSRANKTEKIFSDYDIGLFAKETIPQKLIYKIRNLLDNSNIPFKIDLVDFNTIEDEFKNIALEKAKIWHDPKNLFEKLKN